MAKNRYGGAGAGASAGSGTGGGGDQTSMGKLTSGLGTTEGLFNTFFNPIASPLHDYWTDSVFGGDIQYSPDQYQIDPALGVEIAKLIDAGRDRQARTVQNAANIQTGRSDLSREQALRSRQLGFESRQRQLQGLDQLGLAAQGLVPSAAEIQQRQGLEQALRGQLAAANSARGGAGAQIAAQRQAATAGAGLQAQSARDAAALRANEQAQARSQYQQAASGLRAADAALYGQDVGLQAQDFGQAAQIAAMQNQIALANLQAGLTNDQLGFQQQRAGVDALLNAEQLGFQAFTAPQALQAQIAMANKQAQVQEGGSIFGGAGGILGLIGL